MCSQPNPETHPDSAPNKPQPSQPPTQQPKPSGPTTHHPDNPNPNGDDLDPALTGPLILPSDPQKADREGKGMLAEVGERLKGVVEGVQSSVRGKAEDEEEESRDGGKGR